MKRSSVVTDVVHHADCLDVFRSMPDESVDLIVTDPPFNTGTVRKNAVFAYGDSRSNYIEWMMLRMQECERVLKPTGTICVHLGEKVSYKVRYLVMDRIFGEQSWLNTIVWSFDYGGRGKRSWARKHETILVYVKDPKRHTFNQDASDRLPYMAPGLCGKEKAAKGKLPTDVWWFTVVPTSGKERTGWPTQKPRQILERLIRVSSNPGDVVMDPFAGSGTTAIAAHSLGRKFVMVDDNDQAIQVMRRRFSDNDIEAKFA